MRLVRNVLLALFAAWGWPGPGHASSCLWDEVDEPDSRMAAVTEAFLTAERFRLGSHAYPSMPAGGFPIRFLRDGRLESKQYPPGTRWAIVHGAVKLMRPEGLPSDVFVFDPARGTLLLRRQRPEGSFALEIRFAPPGP